MTPSATTIERRLVARLGSVSGAPHPSAAALVARARERMGAPEFHVRALAFLVATHPAARLPERARVRAVGGLVTAMVVAPADMLEYLGIDGEHSPCRGLIEP